MLHLRLSAPGSQAKSIERELDGLEGVSRIVTASSPPPGERVLSADVEPGAADELVDFLHGFGLPPESYVLSRLDVVAPIPARRAKLLAATGFAWVEVLGEARANSRPLARYLATMTVAAVVAAAGVIDSNGILVVGAMAVAQDLLPISASCVGLVGGRWRLAASSLGTLAVGLALVALVSMTIGALLEAFGILSPDFELDEGGVGTLANVDYSTVLVALAAGVAAMLSFETRASTAVGVAISVTTIPASAYFGAALGLGEGSNALGALLVLGVNVSLLILTGCLTLAAQRAVTRRAAPKPGRA